MVRAYDKNNKEYAKDKPTEAVRSYSSYTMDVPVSSKYENKCDNSGCSIFFHSADDKAGNYW